jgi:type II secretory pathway pseudopilin PulG
MSTPEKNNHGLTLLELMIATVVLVIAISGLLATFINILSLNETSRKLSLAIAACQDKLEEIRNSSFSTLFTTYNGMHFDPDGFLAQDAEGNVYIDNANPNLLEVCVSISWRERSNKIIGEDKNLDGVLNSGEDINSNGRLSSPAEIVTLIGQR